MEDGDIEIFYEQQLDPEATAMAAFPARGREAHFAHWDKIRKDERNEGNFFRTVVADGEVAGNVVSWVQDGHREVGYWIGKNYWGRGIATEALRELLTVIEERPLYASVVRHNKSSIRVLEKGGFDFEREEDDLLVYKISTGPTQP